MINHMRRQPLIHLAQLLALSISMGGCLGGGGGGGGNSPNSPISPTAPTASLVRIDGIAQSGETLTLQIGLLPSTALGFTQTILIPLIGIGLSSMRVVSNWRVG